MLDGVVRKTFPRPRLQARLQAERQRMEEAEGREACSQRRRPESDPSRMA